MVGQVVYGQLAVGKEEVLDGAAFIGDFPFVVFDEIVQFTHFGGERHVVRLDRRVFLFEFRHQIRAVAHEHGAPLVVE